MTEATVRSVRDWDHAVSRQSRLSGLPPQIQTYCPLSQGESDECRALGPSINTNI